jgi:putative transposase
MRAGLVRKQLTGPNQ